MSLPVGGGGTPRSVLPRDFLQPCLLLHLAERSAYGYELLKALRAWGLDYDTGAVYRALHDLERGGGIRSREERSHSGPCRRRYELLPEGEAHLQGWSERLALLQHTLDNFLLHYRGAVCADGEQEPGVALPLPRAAAPPLQVPAGGLRSSLAADAAPPQLRRPRR